MSRKIKALNVLSRNPDDYLRETKHDLYKVHRNYDPNLHHHQEAREYKLALNATKLERVFAKPFIGDMNHNESVSSMARHPDNLNSIFSGTYEGELNLWDTRTRKLMWRVQAHNGHVWSITPDNSGEAFYTVGHDKAIKRWSYDDITNAADPTDVMKGPGSADHLCEPVNTWLCDSVVSGLSHHRYNTEFLTCGQRVLLWDSSKKVPVRSFDWSNSRMGEASCSAIKVKFNMVESNLFASCDMDNNLILYDLRAKDVKKLKMKLQINDLCWNPMEAFILTAASEDFSCYTFDIRYMDDTQRILCEHRGHTSAVTCIDYSPTGREFVSGSFDRSVRIFPVDESRSRDIYHTKRMHKVTSVLWAADNKFIYSGSADHNVRIWKANASEKMGPLNGRERTAMDFNAQLKEKFKHMPEIKRIAKHRHVPKSILNAAKEHFRIRVSKMKKEANVKKHTKPGMKVGETALEKPVFGLQDELLVSEEAEMKEEKKLRKLAEKVDKREKAERRRVRQEEKLAAADGLRKVKNTGKFKAKRNDV